MPKAAVHPQTIAGLRAAIRSRTTKEVLVDVPISRDTMLMLRVSKAEVLRNIASLEPDLPVGYTVFSGHYDEVLISAHYADYIDYPDDE